jgi:hypothetical protein
LGKPGLMAQFTAAFSEAFGQCIAHRGFGL